MYIQSPGFRFCGFFSFNAGVRGLGFRPAMLSIILQLLVWKVGTEAKIQFHSVPPFTTTHWIVVRNKGVRSMRRRVYMGIISLIPC